MLLCNVLSLFIRPFIHTIRQTPLDSFKRDFGLYKNLKAVEKVEGTPYIPFKSNTNGIGKKFDGLWNRMWHYYNFNRSAFLEHYHKRSNVETTFSMIKTKFGGSVRAKTPIAQVNEALCKVLCHNICVLIQSIYELGLEPIFWTFEAKEPVAPKQFSFAGF